MRASFTSPANLACAHLSATARGDPPASRHGESGPVGEPQQEEPSERDRDGGDQTELLVPPRHAPEPEVDERTDRRRHREIGRECPEQREQPRREKRVDRVTERIEPVGQGAPRADLEVHRDPDEERNEDRPLADRHAAAAVAMP